MRPRALGLATLSLFALLLVSTSAFADRPAFVAEPLEPGPFESVTPGPPLPNGPCTMGIVGGATTIINYLLPPSDAYYTLIDPANCVCPNGSIAVNAAHMLLNFQVACTQPVTVAIVGAVDTGGGCLAPDPTNVLCAAVGYNLTPAAAGNFQFNLPMSQNCCITQKAFLEINFILPGAGCSTSSTRPRLITTSNPLPCTSWNIYPGGFDDLIVDIGFPGNPNMWADGDCCATTPAGNSSWGLLKSLYR